MHEEVTGDKKDENRILPFEDSSKEESKGQQVKKQDEDNQIQEERKGDGDSKKIEERPYMLKSLTAVEEVSRLEADEEEKNEGTEKRNFKATEGILKNLNSHPRVSRSGQLVRDSDDSSDESQNEKILNFKVDEGEPSKPTMNLIKMAFVGKYKQTFDKMKEMNKKEKQRIQREPIWEWENEKNPPDALATKVLRILSITWNMNAKKPDKDITNLLRPDIKHDLISIGSEE